MQEERRPGKARAAFRSLAATLSIGFILFFFSETLFWGRPGRAPAAELVVTWLAYSFLAYLFLSAVAVFRAHAWAGLFLAGALYGWLGEGVLVQTMYDSFPLNLSWTGLAWHSLISVCAGWYGLSAALQRGTRQAVLVAAGLGLFWGAWAVMWWQPSEGGHVTPLGDFARHVFSQTALLILPYALYPRFLAPGAFRWRWGHGSAILVVILWFGGVAVPHARLALLLAPPLFALTLLALHRLRRASEAPGVLATLRPLSWTRYLAMLVMPVCALAVYALLLRTGRTYPTNQWIYYVVTPAGFISYLLSLWMAWRRR